MAIDQASRLGLRLRGSVRTRTTAVAVAVVGVGMLGSAIGLVTSLHNVLLNDVRAAATLHAGQAVEVSRAGGDPVAAVAGDDDVVMQILDAQGVVLRTTPNAVGQPALVDRGRRAVVGDDTFWLTTAAIGDGRTLVVGRSVDAVEESTAAITTMLALGVPVLLIVVGLTTWRVVGRALAPVDAIRAEVDEISTAQLHRRVPELDGRDEIARLATTMNRMLDRLERAHSRQRSFVADASHELRSPIAALRQHAEVSLAHPRSTTARDLAQTVQDESLRMQELVEDLLLLAQADENTLTLRRRPIDLDDLVLAEAARLRDLATVVVDIRAVSAARTLGDPAALRRVLYNLGDNARRHARRQVALSLSQVDGWVELRVDDDGPGIAPADRERVFERFVRLDASRSRIEGGSGLGLAIVAEIIAAHGGTAGIDQSHLGGARVTVRLRSG